MNNTPIQVSKTYLPTRREYYDLLESVWDSHWVTNNGPLIQELESKLCDRFDTPLKVVSNGTVALQLAIRALGLSGSVITTPYSYVATTNTLLWADLTPIFVDVEPNWFCLNPELIEEAIRPDTTAILATHVYGYPCDHDALSAIAKKHNLKLVYDAAHAFDVEINGESILNWGHISTLSFHATKVFHTIEGGAVLSDDPDVFERLHLMRSFGHAGREFRSLGINGKNSEFHCGIGLLNLARLAENRAARKRISDLYRELLSDLPLNCLDPADYPGLHYNYAYFPVFCWDNAMREEFIAKLNAEEIYPRRYFEPSLNELDFLAPELRRSCPVSERAASTVVCLPLYPDLPLQDVRRICKIIRKNILQWW
ncbi:MAG: DegT/DnrJ/EryC1/StrS family aminotransferase [Lewinella sp.]